jgi:GNAT superfamily N-acetyltransferase
MGEQYVVRAVRAEEWQKLKELRLAALADPAAPVAFLETRDEAAGKPDVFWQERAARNAYEGTDARQFIAEGPDGSWAGSVTVLVEEAGSTDFFGNLVERSQGHVVGVFLRPEHRGSGLAERLFDGALEWAWALEEPRLERVRLYAHEHNPRARAFYRRIGFVPAGGAVPVPGDDSANDYEYEYAVERA